ncbi:transmembrane protein, putative [Rhizoctonia solani AG-3 Rhs1AP]|uniref:Transmembrane protein, putative n=2 Tax=Rhizoctonia solani AG-3 TaxID=1086053 RepID=X8IX32_9AGAM|nr:transmembrane protein, putative [Rhizoctonia solani AG-3 Rhs1AP]KEP46592.1 putative transmembrane protein [Rhizoctonia solani 123E]
MPSIPFLRAHVSLEQHSGSQEVPSADRWSRLFPRATVGAGSDSTSRSLIIVGITCGTLAAVVLVGIIVYMVIRHRRESTNELQHRRHRNSVPVSSRIRNGYTRTRGSSNSTATSGEQTQVMGEVPQGYFKSWSSRSKNAYLSLPFMGMASSDNLAQNQTRLNGQRYDPESAAGLPSPPKNKKKSPRERLRLDTSIIIPSPKLSNFPSPRHRSSSLMKSATTPPPTAKFFAQSPKPNGVGKPIRPRAELRVGDIPANTKPRPRGGTSGFAGLGSFVPPPPPSWASFWPTESGWTGPGGEPSIRDEDFESTLDRDWEEKVARMDSGEYDSDSEKMRLEHSDTENEDDSKVQYAVYKRTEQECGVGTFRLTPMALQGNGNTRGSMEDVRTPLSDGTTSQFPMSSPIRISTELGSPKLDCGEDPTCRADSRALARAATGRLTLAFGSKSTLSEKAQRSNTKSSTRSAKTHRSGHSKEHSHNASSTHLSVARSGTRVTRSSTMRTERSDWTDTGSPISTVSGHILSALPGHVATPLLRSMDSLRRVGSEYLGQHGDSGASETPISISRTATMPEQYTPYDPSIRADQPGFSLDTSPPRHAPIRRLPDVPPVPPIPRHFTTEPRPLPVPSTSVPAPSVPAHVIPRSASMNLGTSPKDELSTRPVSMGTVPSTIRPLPVLPSSTL